jgi:hypothetical protein
MTLHGIQLVMWTVRTSFHSPWAFNHFCILGFPVRGSWFWFMMGSFPMFLGHFLRIYLSSACCKLVFHWLHYICFLKKFLIILYEVDILFSLYKVVTWSLVAVSLDAGTGSFHNWSGGSWILSAVQGVHADIHMHHNRGEVPGACWSKAP